MTSAGRKAASSAVCLRRLAAKVGGFAGKRRGFICGDEEEEEADGGGPRLREEEDEEEEEKKQKKNAKVWFDSLEAAWLLIQSGFSGGEGGQIDGIF